MNLETHDPNLRDVVLVQNVNGRAVLTVSDSKKFLRETGEVTRTKGKKKLVVLDSSGNDDDDDDDDDDDEDDSSEASPPLAHAIKRQKKKK
ncbi:hypothetical protein H0H92_010172, partial [Tricholoma furcatifolium]